MRYAGVGFILAAVMACGGSSSEPPGAGESGGGEPTQRPSSNQQGSGGGSGGGSGSGRATLTIGDERWEFTEYVCAFGHDGTRSPDFSFSSRARTDAGSELVTFWFDLWEESGQDVYHGDSVTPEIYVEDSDGEVPWFATWRSADVVPGQPTPEGDRPLPELKWEISGKRVTVEGPFQQEMFDYWQPLADQVTVGQFEGECR